MAGVLEDDNFSVGSDSSYLLSKEFSICLITTNRQRRHGQFHLRELREVFGCLTERNKISPAGAHSTWTPISRRVSRAIGLGQRLIFISSEIIPEVLEIDALAPAHQCLWSRTVESEMPDSGVVIYGFPSGNAGEKGIHQDELFSFRGKLRSIRVSNHEA